MKKLQLIMSLLIIQIKSQSNKHYCLFLWILMLVILNAGCFAKKDTIYIISDRVDGLTEESNLTTKGMVIGQIRQISLLEHSVIVEIELKKNIVLSDSLSISIIPRNSFGDYDIELIQYPSEKSIESSDTIYYNLNKPELDLREIFRNP